MKRTFSETESEDIFDEMNKSSPSQSCPLASRKKRRGIIEKRRRDRINNSLSELRRLVPAAFEKQGSAKLEKAEILQMTVDHLKMLHAKGACIDGSFHPYGDAHAYAMDYRALGFRECAAEVARYLVTVEGLDIQDPLRLRLMSHLQCYSAQQEAQRRQAWNNVSSHHSQFTSTTVISQHNNPTDPHLSIPPAAPIQATSEPMRQPIMTSQGPDTASLPTSCHLRMPSSVTSTSCTAQISPQLLSSMPAVHTQFPMSVSTLPVLSPNGFSPTSHTIVSKPYRPWGSELVY
ncbi:hairy/enhancer-of-split related with YRPW motif 1-like [Saccoglossus kowalevskii]|uniref:HEY-like protein n=1 Tax=Saccoglossus kowalevskii TaxID=10224 RepID=B5M227_SACKO|nr:hairy/enhancer-of-split related with YRPW motif 1-like [Saccoglossus kowalevskii]ACH68439.1 HEY-like protein [Saccoglossus kowalevskii]